MVPSSAVRSTSSHIQTLNMQNTRHRWLTAVIMLILNDTACSSRARKCPEQKQRGRNSSRVLLYTVHQLILLSTTFKTAGHRLGPTLKKYIIIIIKVVLALLFLAYSFLYEKRYRTSFFSHPTVHRALCSHQREKIQTQDASWGNRNGNLSILLVSSRESLTHKSLVSRQKV